MDDHDTHFDDCGCLSNKYKEVIRDLLEAAQSMRERLAGQVGLDAYDRAIQKAQELSK